MFVGNSSATFENLSSLLEKNDFDSLNQIISSSPIYYEPFIIKTRDVLVKASRKWLQNLQCSREMFRDIFDNEELENDLCSFIYNEKSLRKITLNLQ